MTAVAGLAGGATHQIRTAGGQKGGDFVAEAVLKRVKGHIGLSGSRGSLVRAVETSGPRGSRDLARPDRLSAKVPMAERFPADSYSP